MCISSPGHRGIKKNIKKVLQNFLVTTLTQEGVVENRRRGERKQITNSRQRSASRGRGHRKKTCHSRQRSESIES